MLLTEFLVNSFYSTRWLNRIKILDCPLDQNSIPFKTIHTRYSEEDFLANLTPRDSGAPPTAS